MQKRPLHLPAIIVSSEASNWGSCRIITPNLEKAYQNLFGKKCNFFEFTGLENSAQLVALAEDILSCRPSHLIFIDHAPHPQALLQALMSLESPKDMPPVIFHVYGDFTLYTPQWVAIEGLLKKIRVHFICASHRQQKMISSFFNQAMKITSVCPFPTDKRNYYFDPDQRKNIRQEMGIPASARVILYTGRISMQKNILRMATEIATYMKNHPEKDIRFYLAGAFDNMGAPFFGVQIAPDHYYLKWQEFLKSQPQEIRSKIFFLGHLSSPELRNLYLAADVYTSLSTHHDEDFGMSPVEALFCGCPVVLSSWGGYASFAIEPDSVRLTPVIIDEQGLKLSSKDYLQELDIFLNRVESADEKQKRSEFFQSHFSISATEKIISRQMTDIFLRFKGFSAKMKEHAKKADRYIQTGHFFNGGPKKNSFYYQIYRHYIDE